MAIDIIARGLATSLIGPDGRISSDKAPAIKGTNDLTGFTSIGKLTDPTLIEGRTAEEILLMMLYGVVNPTFTNPNLSIAFYDDTDQLIIGRPSIIKGTLTFDRGTIEPAYGTSGFRAGVPAVYLINDRKIESNATSFDFDIEVTPDSETIELICSVQYEKGEQPVNSIGQNFESALPAGTITKSVDLNAAYPLYNAKGEDHEFEWFKDDDGAGYLASFESESEGHRQAFAIASNMTVIGIKGFNALTQQWEWIGTQTAAVSLTYFDISVIEGDTLGESIDYILYTYNSTPVGARELKIYMK